MSASQRIAAADIRVLTADVLDIFCDCAGCAHIDKRCACVELEKLDGARVGEDGAELLNKRAECAEVYTVLKCAEAGNDATYARIYEGSEVAVAVCIIYVIAVGRIALRIVALSIVANEVICAADIRILATYILDIFCDGAGSADIYIEGACVELEELDGARVR